MNVYTDQLNRNIVLKDTPKRIISLVPSQTELLHDLGLEHLIVGITKFCVHPKHYKNTIKIIGGTKQVHYDKIKALKPDIILCNKEENTKEMVTELEKIAPVHVSDIFNVDDALILFQQYGALFKVQEKAEILQQELRVRTIKFKDFVKNKPIKKVAYFIWRDPWMVSGSNTIIDYLLQLNKFENVFGDQKRYPAIQLEDLKNKELDYILLSSEPYPFKEKHIEELQKLILNTKIILVDGEYFSWYGSRLISSFDYFIKLRNKIT